MIISFSVKHRSHLLDKFEYAGACRSMSQLMRKTLPSHLRLQIYLDSSVQFPCFLCRKVIKRFEYRCLNDVSVERLYVFGAWVPSVSTVPLYTILLVRQCPFSGHRSGLWQLQCLGCLLPSCSIPHIRTLCSLTMGKKFLKITSFQVGIDL